MPHTVACHALPRLDREIGDVLEMGIACDEDQVVLAR